MSPADIPLHRFPPAWRWVTEPIWRIERAFGRAKAEDRAEDDTRLRIFFVLAIFTAAFLTLAGGAARTALFSDNDRAGAEGVPPGARAELTDRNGQLLAAEGEIARIHHLQIAQHAEGGAAGAEIQYLIGGLTPADKDRIDDLGLPGLSFQPEPKRAYLMGPTAGQLIGFVDRGGIGISGAELALDKSIRADAGKGPVALSIDLRVQAALQDEVEKAAVNFRALDAIGIVTDVGLFLRSLADKLQR